MGEGAATRERTGPGSLRGILSATTHYGLAAYLPRLINFFLLPLYAIYLSPSEMGVLEVCITMDVLMQAVSRAGIPRALSRQYFEHREGEPYRDLVTTSAVASAATTLAVTALVLCLGPWAFARWLPDVPFHPYVDITLVTSMLRLAPEFQSRLLQVTQQARLASRINMMLSVVAVVAKVTLVVGLELAVLGALLADLTAALVAVAIALFRHHRDLTGRVSKDILRFSFGYGGPLVLHNLGGWMQEYGGRWVLASLGVVAAVGQLGVATRVVAPLQVAVGAFATAFLPVYFAWRKDLTEADALREVRRTSAAVITAAAVGTLGAAGFGSVALAHFMPAAYREASPAVGLLSAGILVRIGYNLTGMELFYSGRTRSVAGIFLTGSFCTISVTAALAPRYGLLGAAVAQLLGTAVTVAITAVLARRTFPLAVDRRAFLSASVSAMVASALPFTLSGSFLRDVGVQAAAFLASSGLALALAGVRPAAIQEAWALRRRKTSSRLEPDASEAGQSM